MIANNIGFSRAGKRVCGQDGSRGLIIWTHNLLFGDDPLIQPGGIVDSDPSFVAPAIGALPEGFRLRQGSPALAKGLASIAPHDDLDGRPRTNGAMVDLGAYQK